MRACERKFPPRRGTWGSKRKRSDFPQFGQANLFINVTSANYPTKCVAMHSSDPEPSDANVDCGRERESVAEGDISPLRSSAQTMNAMRYKIFVHGSHRKAISKGPYVVASSCNFLSRQSRNQNEYPCFSKIRVTNKGRSPLFIRQ